MRTLTRKRLSKPHAVSLQLQLSLNVLQKIAFQKAFPQGNVFFKIIKKKLVWFQVWFCLLGMFAYFHGQQIMV